MLCSDLGEFVRHRVNGGRVVEEERDREREGGRWSRGGGRGAREQKPLF